jgi:hypothetical protein
LQNHFNKIPTREINIYYLIFLQHYLKGKGVTTYDYLNINISTKMKKQKKNLKEHGIVSVIQSPNRGENNNTDEDKLGKENEPDKPAEHGIVSVVQSPDEVKNKGKE